MDNSLFEVEWIIGECLDAFGDAGDEVDTNDEDSLLELYIEERRAWYRDAFSSYLSEFYRDSYFY